MLAFFAFRSEEDARRFRGDSPAKVWRIEGTPSFKADMLWLNDPRPGLLGLLQAARGYWSGEKKGGDPSWEYLLRLPVKCIALAG